MSEFGNVENILVWISKKIRWTEHTPSSRSSFVNCTGRRGCSSRKERPLLCQPAQCPVYPCALETWGPHPHPPPCLYYISLPSAQSLLAPCASETWGPHPLPLLCKAAQYPVYPCSLCLRDLGSPLPRDIVSGIAVFFGPQNCHRLSSIVNVY